MLSKPLKKLLLEVAKISISLSLLYWILKDVDIGSIWQHLKQADIKYFFLAIIVTYVTYIFIALRCRVLCKTNNLGTSVLFLIKGLVIAAAINNVVPSTVGGDAYRMYDIYRANGSTRTLAVSVILIDRIIGIVPLILVGLVSSLFATEFTNAIPGLTWVFVIILFVPSTLLWIIFSNNNKILSWFASSNYRSPPLIQTFATKLNNALTLFRGRNDLLARTLLLSLVVQTTSISAVILISMAIKIDLPLYVLLTTIPIANLILLLPISINGLGVREVVFVFLFGVYGIKEEVAIAFVWLYLSIIMIESLMGVLVMVVQRVKIPKMEEISR